MLDILLNGCNGKMGNAISSCCKNSSEYRIACGVDLYQSEIQPFPVFPSFQQVDCHADVIIDFSSPASIDNEIAFALDKKLPLVVGTTGLTDADKQKLVSLSRSVPVFNSSNMSLGINLQKDLICEAAKVLGDSFDIEIIEKHHNLKKDAPSGTAYLLADALKSELPYDPVYTYSRKESTEKREKKEIGIHSIRGGTIVGEHEVLFIGNDEVISIKHQAFSKNVFAEGALRAAAFIANKKPGFYSMPDLLK